MKNQKKKYWKFTFDGLINEAILNQGKKNYEVNLFLLKSSFWKDFLDAQILQVLPIK